MFQYHEILNKGQEIEERLRHLGAVSKTEGVPGIWRAIHTDSDRRGKALIAQWMKAAGLKVREDCFGNIYGRLEGEVSETILTGSHVDTVKNGGLYDGACGVVTAVSAVDALVQAGWKPHYSVEIIGIEEEEGSRFDLLYAGSRAIVGKLLAEELDCRDENGTMLRELMEGAGCDWRRLSEADRRGEVKEFIELHVEQGAVLHREGLSIGLVESITGLLKADVTICGEQNHAGTTPMYLRRDPLVKTAELILKMTERVRKISPTAVITIGELDLQPGVSNVIPGQVHFVIDMRDGDGETLLTAKDAVEDIIYGAEEDGFRTELKIYSYKEPVPLDRELVDSLEEAAEDAGAAWKRMNSGAGHDSMAIAGEIPTCMIFIPSADGISHSPKEYTSPEDLSWGCEVLGRLLVKRAR